MHLRQPGFTYIYLQCLWIIYKKQKRIHKPKETGDSGYISQNELDKTCFQHDMGYRYFKDLTRITASDKVLCDKPFNIAINRKYDRYQRGLALMVYKFFDKNTTSVAATLPKKSVVKNENISNKELVEELHKLIIRKIFKKSQMDIIANQTIYGQIKSANFKIDQ